MRKAVCCAALSGALGLVESKALRWSNPEPRWVPPEQTGLVYMPSLGISPVPTSPPQVKPRKDILARSVPDNTCGFINGNTDASLSCDITARCVYNSLNSHIGCCDDTTSGCPVWTTCYDSTDRSKYTTNNGFTIWCGNSSFPHCTTYLYQDRGLVGYTLLGCAVAAGTAPIWYSPPIASISTSVRSTSSSITPSRTTSSSSSETSSETSSGTSTTPPTPPTTPDPSPTPVGAIVGGVVGGLGAIALIVLGIWALMRHNDKQKKKNAEASAAAAAAAAAAATTNQPQNQPPPGPGPQDSPEAKGYYGGVYSPSVAQQQNQPSPGPGPQDPHMSQVPSPGAKSYYGGVYSPTATTLYPNDQGIHSVVSPSPSQSPGPGYQPHGTPSPPPQQGAYGQPQPGYPQQYGNMSPGATSVAGGYGQQPQGGYPQQGGAYGAPAPGDGPHHFAAELPAHRGDGELRELQG
ncbi:hypothetical protein VTI74DRAFT_11244 [Chaetomium olivicolor]